MNEEIAYKEKEEEEIRVKEKKERKREAKKKKIEENEKFEKNCNDLYKDFKIETEKRQVSSSENFDKSILTYSSWALGLSVAFLKDFIPIGRANQAWLLYSSWIFFGLAIALTTISFLISYKGLQLSLTHAGKYYLERDECYFNRKNHYNTIVNISNMFCAAFFIIALIFTIIFVSLNLQKSYEEKELEKMAKETKTPKIISGIAMDGLPIGIMQAIPGTKKPIPVQAQSSSRKIQASVKSNTVKSTNENSGK